MVKTEERATPFITPGWFAVIVISLAVFFWWLWWRVGVRFFASRYASEGSETLAQLGQTGDMFGGINALFAAFAFAGVAVAAYYQHLTWRLLSRQAEEIGHRHAQESFEPLFFKLLERRAPPGTLMLPTRIVFEGRAAGGIARQTFDEAMETLRGHVQRSGHYANALLTDGRESLDRIGQVWESAYQANESTLGPYFRSTYHLFKLIHTSGITQERKRLYAGIARASLSSNEVLALILNCLTDRGKGLHDLARTYSIFKHATLGVEGLSPDATLAVWAAGRESIADPQDGDVAARLEQAQIEQPLK